MNSFAVPEKPQATQDPRIQTSEFLSQPYKINKIYKSMEGPSGSQQIRLLDTQPPELVWITKYSVEVVGEDGRSPVSQEFMCHNNLDFNPSLHGKTFGWSKITTSRLFTLSQGQFTIEFPKGFGIPVLSDESFFLITQVLNHNIKDIDINVRHKVSVDFIRELDLKPGEEIKPLFPASGFVMALMEGKDGFFGLNGEPNEIQKHANCLPGEHAPNGTITGVYKDNLGRVFSGHWVVKPGREERRTLVTKWLRIPYDTTVHFIAVHVHPFCESLELRDLNTGKTVFKSYARRPDKGVGLANVDYFSSQEGIPLYKDHEYEMISVYDNDSGVNQDSMATFFLYLLDKDFQKPVQMSYK